MIIHGQRVADNELRENPFRPGAYGRVDVGGEKHRWQWWACTPNGMLGNLDAHDVTEHSDGTITVSPSIEISGGKTAFIEGDDKERYDSIGLLGYWHGYLERGNWRKC